MSQSAQDRPDPEEFQDPLENYEPQEYSDRLEQALAEEPAVAIQSTPYASVPPDTPIREAIERLAELHVACLLVEENDQLVGIFADRDVLDKVALEYEEIRDQPVSDVMTTNPVYAYDTDSSGGVLSVMAVSGYRHVPVLTHAGKILGIASPQRVTDFLQQYFAEA